MSAYSIEQNQWNGETYLEVSLNDVRPSLETGAEAPASATETSPLPL